MTTRRKACNKSVIAFVGVFTLLFSLLATSFAQAGTASIQGTVYDDLNCSSQKDVVETGIPDWKVYLRGVVGGLPPILDSTTTDSSGIWQFTALEAGDYSVAVDQQPGHAQTGPHSVDYQLALSDGQTVTERDFGFKDTTQCGNAATVNCPAGVADVFDTGNGPEPSSPSSELLTAMAACGTPLSAFDTPASNSCFGHTYSSCWSDESCIIGATLTTRLRASSAGSSDDELHLGDWPTPGSIWSIPLSLLLEIKTGGADVSWDPGDTMTVELDLANLPIAVRGVSNILAALQDADLDLLISDETEVDFSNLKTEDG